MSARERAEDLEGFIQRELEALLSNLDQGAETSISIDVKNELANVFGTELINRLFGKKDFATLPELSSLATASLKTKAIVLAEMKIWERLMRDGLMAKNQAVLEVRDQFIRKTADLYEELQEALSKEGSRYLSDIEKSHQELVQLLKDESKAVKEINGKGERLRLTDKNSVQREVDEYTRQISETIKKAVDEKVKEVVKDAPYNEYEHKEYVINQLYCLGSFLLGGSVVAFGFYLMKLFN